MACEKVQQIYKRQAQMLDDKRNCWEKKLIVNRNETDVEHRFSWLCEAPARSEIGKLFQSNNRGEGGWVGREEDFKVKSERGI